MSAKQQEIPIGISDFRKMREDGYYYIDKTGFIRDVMNASAEVLLLPRPRRFGKTLNMSMLHYFFEKCDEDRSGLFQGLMVYHDEVFSQLGTYPVISLTFKDVRNRNWTECQESLHEVIYQAYAQHRYLLESDALFSEEKEYIHQIIHRTLNAPGYQRSLKYLSDYLCRHHGKRVIILIDEYDAPVHAGYAHGYYEDVIVFLRNFLSGGLKDNPHLKKGVLTGILRVARESIFSGLNNPGVYTLLSPRFSEAFGFTEPEVKSLLKDYDMEAQYDKVSFWYNGYQFGKTVIYNPWSVLNYIVNQGEPNTYWANTGNPAIIEALVTKGGTILREELGQLMENETIEKPVYEDIVMRNLETQEDLVWSFLLFSGYLKPIERVDSERYRLHIPNQEVRMIYRQLVRSWFTKRVESPKVENMLKALEAGNVEEFERYLTDIVEKVVSYHDTSEPEPEKFYHAFVLGLLVWLEGKYTVKSNRESGYGRYDVMLIPENRNKQGIIIEFKKVDTYKKEKPEQALDKAMQQIEEKRYGAELEAAGVQNILKLAIAFRGKELWISSQ